MLAGRRIRISHRCWKQRLSHNSVLNRSFHASRPNLLLAEAVQLSHGLFETVHSVSGLPWIYSIPLTTLIVRLAWLPVQYWTNVNSTKRNAVNPLLVAWRQVYQKQARAKFTEPTVQSANAAERWVQEMLQDRNKRLTSDYKITSRWTTMAMQASFLPIYILNGDVIRRMAGSDRSILGVLKGTNENGDANLVPMEPEFLEESFAWIPDLVTTDPFWILPISFGGLALANIWFAMGKDVWRSKQKVAEMSVGTAQFQQKLLVQISEALMTMAFFAPFILVRNETPSAVLLYLVGSAGSQLMIRGLLKKIMNVRPGIEPAIVREPQTKSGSARYIYTRKASEKAASNDKKTK